MQAYKMVVKGTAGTQEIVTVFYAARSDGSDVEQSEAAYTGLRVLWDSQIGTAFLSCASDSYQTQSFIVSVVDEVGQTVSDFTGEATYVTQGVLTGALDTYAQAGVVGFKCQGLTSQPATIRIPKRSYILTPPIPSSEIDDDGRLTASYASNLATLATACANFAGTVGDNAYAVEAVRVGVRAQDNSGAMGRIIQGVARPYSTFRRSRMIRPTG